MQPKLAEFVLSVQGARFMSKPKPIQVDQIIGNIVFYELTAMIFLVS